MKQLKSKLISGQIFSPEQVKAINKEIKKNIIQKEASFSPAAGASTEKKGDFFHVPCNPLMGLLHPWLYQCQIANRDSFGYDIYWDFHIEVLNYNVYGIGGEYSWHIDANTETMYDMKLTCMLNLSEEPYEWGEFEANGIDEKIKFDSGDGLVLNSLVAHRVTPVTKGERITLTYWGYGPAWR